LAQAKTVYADGDVIYREGDLCEHAFELLSGGVDLLKQKDGKYVRQGTVKPGAIFANPGETFEATARASGRTVVRGVKGKPGTPAKSEPSKGVMGNLMRHLSTRNEPPEPGLSSSSAYSNPGMIRRLLEGLATDADRIGVRIAMLTGEGAEKNTRHVISALGNSQSIQTRGFKNSISLDSSGDIVKQLDRISSSARKWLLQQDADVLIWGHIPSPGHVIHLHFITLANWDQQAPGAFDPETFLALPVDFGTEFADLLRAVALAASIPRSNEKKHLRAQALFEALNAGLTALDHIPPEMTTRERVSIHMCFANSLCAASRPGYNSELLGRAADRYRNILTMLSQHESPQDWAIAQKHLGSILHIEAERNGDADQLEEAIISLRAAFETLEPDRHPKARAILQNRLGLICYRQGFEDSDTALLRQSLSCFRAALNVYTREEAPLRWAEIMSNFAQAAQVLGGHMKSMEALATAANACRAVLEVRNRKKTPMSWAATQNNLGSALFMLGKQTRSIERLEAAITAFELALEVYETARSQRMAAVTANNLDRAREMLENFTPRNISSSEWNDILFDKDGDEGEDENIFESSFNTGPTRLPEPGEGLFIKDDLPWPGEGLTASKTGPRLKAAPGPKQRSDPEWFLEAV